MSKTARTEAEAGGVHPAAARPDALLAVNDLKKHFPIRQGIVIQRQIGAVRAVDGVSFSVARGETLGLVGESGCGKSTTGRVLAKLLEPTAGSVMFEGQDIAGYSRRRMRALRTDIQMIFQDPYSSLNPRHTIGTIVGEPFRIQKAKTENGIKAEVQGLMERVGLNPEHYNRYPHEFSGGQRQRIGIARALATNPRLVVADEPVSALDVSVQAQVLNLLLELQARLKLTFLFVAHDLSVVRHISDRVAVMYVGQLVELAPTGALFAQPLHPYTAALMRAVPVADPRVHKDDAILTGEVPSPANPPPGCYFHPRCRHATDRCKVEAPALREIAPGHFSRCHYAGETVF